MEQRIRHDLGSLERAREVVERAYGEYKTKLADYNPVLEWSDSTRARIGFTAMSKTIWIDAVIGAQELVLSGKLPLMFRPFQGKIMGVVESEVRKWVDKAKAEAESE
jgi:hypothetical protein